MAQRQVNATRMQLMQMRRRLTIAVRGHSLLKDKLEGLMADFIEMVERYREARESFDQEYPAVIKLFVLAGMAGTREAVGDALKQSRSRLEINVAIRNVVSVRVPHFEATVHPGGGYSLLDTPLEFDEAMRELAEFLPRILELAELEHSVWMLMEEIERTRRRVNALEYILIPDLRYTVRYIRAKLDENERSNITRLMKIKDMRLKEELEAARRRREARGY